MFRKNKFMIVGIILAMLVICPLIVWAATGGETVSMEWTWIRGSTYRNPVWSAVVTCVWDDDDTADVTQEINVNGIIQKIILSAPDGSNAVTYQVVITDNEGYTIFDSGEQAEDADYAWSVHEPVNGTISVIVGPSGAIGATNPDAVVVLRGI